MGLYGNLAEIFFTLASGRQNGMVQALDWIQNYLFTIFTEFIMHLV